MVLIVVASVVVRLFSTVIAHFHLHQSHVKEEVISLFLLQSLSIPYSSNGDLHFISIYVRCTGLF